jgi:curved DNA-binding protein CbpA
VWDVSESTISKAYRRASLAVHPDKNPLPEAKAAFDKLNDAVRALRDDVRRGEALRSFADAAFQDKCRANPELMAKAKKAQERVDAENYGDMIRAQQSQQLERARLQREKAKLIAIRRRNREADGASSSDVSTDTDSDNDDDDAKADAVMKDAVQVKAEKEKAGGEGVSNGGGDGATNGGGERKKIRGGGGGRGGRRKARADSDSDDDGGLARPVLGTKKKPRFIM